MTLRAKLTATFATLMATLALCAGLATPALANETASSQKVTNDSGLSTLTLQKDVKISGITGLTSDITVSFTAEGATPSSNTVNGMTAKTGIGSISINSLTFSSGDDTSTSDTDYTASKTVTVNLPSGQSWEPNTAYYYKITESTSPAGIFTSESPISLGLYLYTDNDSSSTKVVAATIVGPSGGKTDLKFTNENTTTTHKLTVTKTTAGNMASDNDDFTFKIYLQATSDTGAYAAGASVPVSYKTTSSAEAQTTTATIESASSTTPAGTAIAIKGTGSIEVTIPEGLRYAVAEVGAGSGGNGYDATLKVDGTASTLQTGTASNLTSAVDFDKSGILPAKMPLFR